MSVATTADANAVRRCAARRDEFAVHNVRVVDARPGRRQWEGLDRRWELMRYRCRRFSIDPLALERLDSAVTRASSGAAAAMMHLIDLCIADTGFIFVVVDDDKGAGFSQSFLEAAQSIFDRELLSDACGDRGLSVRLTRPVPRRLERSLDPDLLAAIVGNGDEAIRAWSAWRRRANLDEHLGFGEVAPMLSENLSRLGVHDIDQGRIDGIRRRAWYVNQLLTHQTATAVSRLLEEGFEPTLLGDIPAAVRAGEVGSVRPVRAVDLCVPPDDAARVAHILERLGWMPARGGPLTETRLERQTWRRFRIDQSRALLLHWRTLPQGCSRLVAHPADDASGRVTLHDVHVKTQSPTAALLRLWARTGDAMPGHQLRTLCDTAELMKRCPDDIDWTRLWSDCVRLGLVEYGETYLRMLPAGLGDAGLQELQSQRGARWD
jgi:hypothetical protein